MNRAHHQKLWVRGSFSGLLTGLRLDISLQADRVRFMERDVCLTIKVVLLGMMSFYLYYLDWEGATKVGELALDTFKGGFLAYLIANLLVAAALLFMAVLPFALVHWAVFVMNLVDGIFMALMVVVTGGVNSTIYWVFHFLIVRNSISLPTAGQQVALNLIVISCYVFGGVLDRFFSVFEDSDDMKHAFVTAMVGSFSERAAEPLLVKVALLLLLAVCCYAIQVLFLRQLESQEEAREFNARQDQLRSTGRLAAEIAHQLKNPLAIINNAAFNLQRSLKGQDTAAATQLGIIREEVDRSDRIITELMGYAQLTEGRVEKLDLQEELASAISQALPVAVGYEVEVVRDFGPDLPPLLMQRAHLKEVLVNILLNAREAVQGRGRIAVSAKAGRRNSVTIVISDNGPGIPAAQQAQIFEPYFSTKEKGTGLGLAIVKHNTELYGGKVRVESELGKGTRFILEFPPKATMTETR